MIKSVDEIDFEKSGGLIPIIVQDANTKDVLTLAYSNKESLELTKKTGNSWFFSRSRNKLCSGDEARRERQPSRLNSAGFKTNVSATDADNSINKEPQIK